MVPRKRYPPNVKSIKTQIRQILLQAGAEAKWWPWATRYVNELNRFARIGNRPNWPLFLADVMVRKRTWRRGTFEVSTETVKYLCPAPEDHGHWIIPKDERPRITKMIMKPATLPLSEQGWVAIEKETVDALVVRRRMREKSSIRKIGKESEDEIQEEEEKKKQVHLLRVIEEEMRIMVDDPPDLALEELKILGSLKKLATPPTEEEEILQTRIVSPKEVAENWDEWLPAIKSEVESLLQEKEAFREVFPDELRRLQKEAEEKGKGIEFIPSKLVFTRKPGPGGGKKKMRWVACGNLEPKKAEEDNFSSGADASALRILVWCAARYQWLASTLDVRTAFLNAKMVLSEEEDLILVKPPALLTEKKFLRRDVYYLPEKAIYGLRRSPKLWGITRDDTIKDFDIQGEFEGKKMRFNFEPLQSEPNLWKLQNAEDPEDVKVYGLLMTYVDDLLVTAPQSLMTAVIQKIQSTWTTSSPELVTDIPIRFLGMEISKIYNENTQRDDWMLTQQSYTLDLVQKEDEKVKPKKVPMSRDQAAMEPKEETPSIKSVRLAQKAVGEALWLTTRARPDIMYVVLRMGSAVTRAPEAVLRPSQQLKGYLSMTTGDGLKFEVGKDEDPLLVVFTDASFAPDSEESHGAFVVLLGTTPVFWKSGRQGFVTLSTAEAELTEIIEGMVAGESIHVILQELDLHQRPQDPQDRQHASSVDFDRRWWQLAHTSLASSCCLCKTVSVCR